MYSFFTSNALQIILAAIIIVAVLFQQSEKGLDGAFGGSGVDGDTRATVKRGLELRLYHITIFCAFLLAGSVIVKIIFA